MFALRNEVLHMVERRGWQPKFLEFLKLLVLQRGHIDIAKQRLVANLLLSDEFEHLVPRHRLLVDGGTRDLLKEAAIFDRGAIRRMERQQTSYKVIFRRTKQQQQQEEGDEEEDEGEEADDDDDHHHLTH